MPLVLNRADALRKIKGTDSFRPRSETMFNQCVVLLVSYFGSGVHGLFRAAVVQALRSGADVPVASEEVTVAWQALQRTEGEREAIFADLLVAQNEISFQSMKSIGRAFKTFFWKWRSRAIRIAKTTSSSGRPRVM